MSRQELHRGYIWIFSFVWRALSLVILCYRVLFRTMSFGTSPCFLTRFHSESFASHESDLIQPYLLEQGHISKWDILLEVECSAFSPTSFIYISNALFIEKCQLRRKKQVVNSGGSKYERSSPLFPWSWKVWHLFPIQFTYFFWNSVFLLEIDIDFDF